jgi:hypothetical protein
MDYSQKYLKYKEKYINLKNSLNLNQFGGNKKFLIIGGPITSDATGIGGTGTTAMLFDKDNVDKTLFATLGNHSDSDYKGAWYSGALPNDLNSGDEKIPNLQFWNSINDKFNGITIDRGSEHWLPNMQSTNADLNFLANLFDRCLNDNGIILIDISFVDRLGNNIFFYVTRSLNAMKKNGKPKYIELKGFINIVYKGPLGHNISRIYSVLAWNNYTLPKLDVHIESKDMHVTQRGVIYSLNKSSLDAITPVSNISTDAKFLQKYF